MSGKKQKYYVVWQGHETGIFDTWAECKALVEGYPGPVYKSFASREEAETAYAEGPELHIRPKCASRQKAEQERQDRALLPIVGDAWAVDAACSGNPGPMEYRCVDLKDGKEVFHFGPVHGTNNIGEFLAIVHALALLDKMGETRTIYSDSRNAMLWVKGRRCKTKLELNAKTKPLFEIIERAERWLATHPITCPILKWETDQWGEVPADFGRK